MSSPKPVLSLQIDHHNHQENASHHINNNNSIIVRNSAMNKKPPGAVKYMDCLKNHAAAIGGAATDGCGEFMPGGAEGSLEALKCSACNCHRNFHRKIHIPPPPPQPSSSAPPPVIESAMKKRFRTKFTQEQKEKMVVFAERAGWKMQKLDEGEVRRFCGEIGIKRKVLKVWMHNNKYHLAKKINNDDDIKKVD